MIRSIQFALFLVLATTLVDRSCAQDPAGIEKRTPVKPTKKTQRGDFEIEHYDLKSGDLLKFKIRGVYQVSRITDGHLVLTPTQPTKQGVLAGDWEIANGRIAIGNRHYFAVRSLEPENGRASIQIEYKTRWHWWDAFAF